MTPDLISAELTEAWLQGGKRTVLLTEFMERGDLFTLLGRGYARFAWDRLGARIALDVAEGLQFLHSRNIVHFE